MLLVRLVTVFRETVLNPLRFSIGSFDLINHQVGKLSQRV